jgi:hypothetical protein
MLQHKGHIINEWRHAMASWRERGDVTGLAEVAARMDPSWRRMFLDTILPSALRQDLAALLRREAVSSSLPSS